MRYKIAADSSANLREMEGVDFASAPLTIVTDERQFVDDEGLDLDDMLSHLASYKGRSGTACPSVGDWLEAFGDAEGVFAVAITSGQKDLYQEGDIIQVTATPATGGAKTYKFAGWSDDSTENPYNYKFKGGRVNLVAQFEEVQ